MDSTPFPRITIDGKTPPQYAGNNQQDNKIRGYCSLGHVESAVLRKKRDKRVQHVHVQCAGLFQVRRRYLQHDVHDEERQRPERDRAVHGLGDNAMAGVQDGPVRRQDAHAGRAGQQHKREDAAVLQHEVIRGRQHDVPDRRHQGGESEQDHAACDGRDDHRPAFCARARGRGTGARMATRAGAGRCHDIPPQDHEDLERSESGTRFICCWNGLKGLISQFRQSNRYRSRFGHSSGTKRYITFL